MNRLDNVIITNFFSSLKIIQQKNLNPISNIIDTYHRKEHFFGKRYN